MSAATTRTGTRGVRPLPALLGTLALAAAAFAAGIALGNGSTDHPTVAGARVAPGPLPPSVRVPAGPGLSRLPGLPAPPPAPVPVAAPSPTPVSPSAPVTPSAPVAPSSPVAPPSAPPSPPAGGGGLPTQPTGPIRGQTR